MLSTLSLGGGISEGRLTFPDGVKGTAVRGAAVFGVGGKWLTPEPDGVTGMSGSANPLLSAVPVCLLPDLGDPRLNGDFKDSNLCFAFWTDTACVRDDLLADAAIVGEA